MTRRCIRSREPRQFAVPAHRGLRVPLRLPHGGSGRTGWLGGLAVRAGIRLPERVRQPAGPRRGRVQIRPLRHQCAHSAVVRAGDQRADDDLAHARRLAARPRSTHDRASQRARHGHPAHASPADDDGEHLLVRLVECLEGSVEVELVCEPAFDYGRQPAEWSMVDEEWHAADAHGMGQTFRLSTEHVHRARGRIGARAAHPVGR